MSMHFFYYRVFLLFLAGNFLNAYHQTALNTPTAFGSILGFGVTERFHFLFSIIQNKPYQHGYFSVPRIGELRKCHKR